MDGAPACGCGGPPLLPKTIRREYLEELVLHTKLKPNEVKALYARFRRLAPTGFLLPEQFKNTMGVLGLTDDPFLPDRMFRVFDQDQDGKLSFLEFASSLAVMIRGTEDEKLHLSFQMAAGQRGAGGIMLEDFQRLVSACNTMMSSLVGPSRGPTSNEDAARLFYELASGGSSTDGEAVLTFEAYRKAAQDNEDFLVCLGLEPHGRKTHRSRANTASSTALAIPAPRSSDGVSTGPAQQDHVVVSMAQIEELRARVSAFRSAAQQHRARSPVLPAGTPPSAEELDDRSWTQRWWMPMCGCTPAQRRADTMGDMISEVALPRDVSMEARRNPFEEVCTELDGIIGWCARCHEGAHGGISLPPLGNPFCLNSASTSSRLPVAPSGSRDTLVAVLRDVQEEFSRSLSLPVETGLSTRPQVHARPTSQTQNAAQSRGVHGRSRATSMSSSSRQRRRHRLLGPKKGLAVHFGHENWNMVLSMMIGIRMAVGRSKHEITRELQPVDFIMKEKFSIIPRLANIFDSAVSKRITMTRFIDYAPMVFQRIRSSFGIHHDDYLRSVGPEQLLGNMVLGNLASLSELSSEGKSGAFFYYTADGKYMMKTVSPKEHKLLKKMLKSYYDHITQYPGTLIVRFLGLHSLRVHKDRKAGIFGKPLDQSNQKLYFVVMGNMFNAPFDIHRRYDLKGSWVGRITHSETFDPSVALKDVDFKQANESIRVGDERRATLMAQIESDSAFLRDNNIIDYSLLLGICELGTTTIAPGPVGGAGVGVGAGADDTASETASERHAETGAICSVAALAVMDRPATGGAQTAYPGSPHSAVSGVVHIHSAMREPNQEVPLHQRDMGGMLSSDKKSLYFFGIIDILTPYDAVKKLEHIFKAVRHDRRGVSCCPPGFYSERFTEFLRGAFV